MFDDFRNRVLPGDIYLTGVSAKTIIKAIKIVAIYNKKPRANQVSRFELLNTLILCFLCFIAITRCFYLADKINRPSG